MNFIFNKNFQRKIFFVRYKRISDIKISKIMIFVCTIEIAGYVLRISGKEFRN